MKTNIMVKTAVFFFWASFLLNSCVSFDSQIIEASVLESIDVNAKYYLKEELVNSPIGVPVEKIAYYTIDKIEIKRTHYDLEWTNFSIVYYLRTTNDEIITFHENRMNRTEVGGIGILMGRSKSFNDSYVKEGLFEIIDRQENNTYYSYLGSADESYFIEFGKIIKRYGTTILFYCNIFSNNQLPSDNTKYRLYAYFADTMYTFFSSNPVDYALEGPYQSYKNGVTLYFQLYGSNDDIALYLFKKTAIDTLITKGFESGEMDENERSVVRENFNGELNIQGKSIKLRPFAYGVQNPAKREIKYHK
jgi:hypothetical protein